MHDFTLEQQRIKEGVKTMDEVLEKLRKMLVLSQKSGKNLMIDLGKTEPDFTT